MRILVTNDDGVRAPGIAALARAAVASGHGVTVVAPLVDYSGAGAAVGPVHSRDGVDYEVHAIEGLDDVPVFGIDGPPALAVILACVGAFGDAPDLVLSGINHGANVGRSAMHSGTIGAALTGAHFGLRGLAVSIRFGDGPVPWDTPATLAAALVPVVAGSPPGTVLNLNTPDVPIGELRGIRYGALGRTGTIRSAVHQATGATDEGARHVTLPPAPAGTLRLDMALPWPTGTVDLTTDAGLVAQDFASLTPLVGVRQAEEASAVVAAALRGLESATGVGQGVDQPPPAAGT